MFEQTHAGTDIGTGIGVLPFPVNLLDVIGNIKRKLRTGKEEDTGHTAQTDTIAQMHRDGQLLDNHGVGNSLLDGNIG